MRGNRNIVGTNTIVIRANIVSDCLEHGRDVDLVSDVHSEAQRLREGDAVPRHQPRDERRGARGLVDARRSVYVNLIKYTLLAENVVKGCVIQVPKCPLPSGHSCVIPLTLRGSWRPLRLMNERRIWSLHCPHVQIYTRGRGTERERERAVPISTVGLELSQTQYSLSVALISHVEPTTREREGDRGTRQDSRSGEGQKATLNHRVIHSLVFDESIYILNSHVKTPFYTATTKSF